MKHLLLFPLLLLGIPAGQGQVRIELDSFDKTNFVLQVVMVNTGSGDVYLTGAEFDFYVSAPDVGCISGSSSETITLKPSAVYRVSTKAVACYSEEKNLNLDPVLLLPPSQKTRLHFEVTINSAVSMFERSLDAGDLVFTTKLQFADNTNFKLFTHTATLQEITRFCATQERGMVLLGNRRIRSQTLLQALLQSDLTPAKKLQAFETLFASPMPDALSAAAPQLPDQEQLFWRCLQLPSGYLRETASDALKDVSNPILKARVFEIARDSIIMAHELRNYLELLVGEPAVRLLWIRYVQDSQSDRRTVALASANRSADFDCTASVLRNLEVHKFSPVERGWYMDVTESHIRPAEFTQALIQLKKQPAALRAVLDRTLTDSLTWVRERSVEYIVQQRLPGFEAVLQANLRAFPLARYASYYSHDIQVRNAISRRELGSTLAYLWQHLTNPEPLALELLAQPMPWVRTLVMDKINRSQGATSAITMRIRQQVAAGFKDYEAEEIEAYVEYLFNIEPKLATSFLRDCLGSTSGVVRYAAIETVERRSIPALADAVAGNLERAKASSLPYRTADDDGRLSAEELRPSLAYLRRFGGVPSPVTDRLLSLGFAWIQKALLMTASTVVDADARLLEVARQILEKAGETEIRSEETPIPAALHYLARHDRPVLERLVAAMLKHVNPTVRAYGLGAAADWRIVAVQGLAKETLVKFPNTNSVEAAAAFRYFGAASVDVFRKAVQTNLPEKKIEVLLDGILSGSENFDFAPLKSDLQALATAYSPYSKIRETTAVLIFLIERGANRLYDPETIDFLLRENERPLKNGLPSVSEWAWPRRDSADQLRAYELTIGAKEYILKFGEQTNSFKRGLASNYGQLALWHLAQGHLPDAARAAKRAADIAPESTDAQSKYALTLLLQGQIEPAREIYRAHKDRVREWGPNILLDDLRWATYLENVDFNLDEWVILLTD